MSERAEDGVVNAFGQSHDVPNLLISDGSQFTTGAAANPTLTIVALAIRQAEYIADQMASADLEIRDDRSRGLQIGAGHRLTWGAVSSYGGRSEEPGKQA